MWLRWLPTSPGPGVLGHLNSRAWVLTGPSQTGGLSPLTSDWFKQKHVVYFWPMRHEETLIGGFWERFSSLKRIRLRTPSYLFPSFLFPLLWTWSCTGSVFGARQPFCNYENPWESYTVEFLINPRVLCIHIFYSKDLMHVSVIEDASSWVLSCLWPEASDNLTRIDLFYSGKQEHV